jgi:hypothetical protein
MSGASSSPPAQDQPVNIRQRRSVVSEVAKSSMPLAPLQST